MSRVSFSTRRIAPLMAAIVLLASGAAPATELYQWTDANGVVHYTDTPPTNKSNAQHTHIDSVENSKPETTANAKPPNGQKDGASGELPNTPENRKRLCDEAHSQIEVLQSKFQVADADGKKLDDKERADRTAQAQQAVTNYCADGQ